VGFCWQVFTFADRYRGRYSDGLGGVVCPFYCSYSGYNVRGTYMIHMPKLHRKVDTILGDDVVN
jgi:hypothetical protein